MKKKIISGIISAAMLIGVIPNVFADDVNEKYDEVKFINTCDTKAEGVTLNDAAPDGTKFYTTGNAQYTSLGGLNSNTSEDYMWEADVRFDSVGSGFTVMGSKVDTCIRRYDESDGTSKLAIQTGGSSYVRYDVIEADEWYHIQLIGQFGTSEPMKMELYKWINGEKVFISEYDSVNKRQNQPARYIVVEANTSIDNVQITKIGADTLTVSTMPEGITEIHAGAEVNMQFSALRNGRSINKPKTEWKLFENGEEITDGSVVVSSEGLVSVAQSCKDKTVTVKAVSTEKGHAEGEYSLKINAVDFENALFDTISITAEKNHVREGEPLSLAVSAKKNGEIVEIPDGEITWSFYDEQNVQKIGNKYIYVTENKLYVTDKVISQNIIVRASNNDNTVYASLPVRIKAADATEADEQGRHDKILATDAGEDIDNIGITKGSWDGSHCYKFENAGDMKSVIPTNEDVIIEADIRFLEENSGIKLRNNGNSKEGGQIARQGSKIGRIGSGGKFLSFANGDAVSWYHIVIIARCGADETYGKVYIYRYDKNGELVNPDSGENEKAAVGTLDLRTMVSQYFNHIQVQAGTEIDNMRIMKLIPDVIEITLSADTIFAGNTTQAKYSVSRKGENIMAYPLEKITWSVYDSEDKYPVDTELISIDKYGIITVDATVSAQAVHVRATLNDGGAYTSKLLMIKGSDIFTVKGIGVNKEGNKISELKIEKNFFYSGDIIFLIAVYDDEGVLLGTKMRNMHDNTLALGENKIAMELDLPNNFAEVKAMIWTSL